MLRTRQLFQLCQVPDIGDPKAFVAGVVAILAEYPVEVMEQVTEPSGIPSLTRRPYLADIRKACEEAYGPIERRIEREMAQRRALPEPVPRPRTPEEQAAVDEQVARVRRERGIG
jgi:hypothetical protein